MDLHYRIADCGRVALPTPNFHLPSACCSNAPNKHVIEAAYLASISITFTSIFQMIALVLVRQWGPGWGIVA